MESQFATSFTAVGFAQEEALLLAAALGLLYSFTYTLNPTPLSSTRPDHRYLPPQRGGTAVAAATGSASQAGCRSRGGEHADQLSLRDRVQCGRRAARRSARRHPSENGFAKMMNESVTETT